MAPGEVLPLSIVIPAYRRPEMVERALRSVARQTVRPAEVIVVDDHSEDETGRRAAAMQARVITHEANLGEGAARNTGIDAATHEWVALLDSDDEWLPDHLQTVWAARGEYVVVSAAALGCGSSTSAHRVFGWTGARPRQISSPGEILVPENKLVPSAVLLRRSAIIAIGGFTPAMPLAADLDTWVRLLRLGPGLALPRITTLYHLHGGQASIEPTAMWDAHRSVLERHVQRNAHDRGLIERYEGVRAWDSARAALHKGRPAAPVALRLIRQLRSRDRLVGVAQLLSGRLRGRRIASRYAPGGAPLVARLPGTVRPVDPPASELDLRGRSPLAALLHVLRRPPTAVIAPSRVIARVLRWAGIKTVILDRR